MIRYLICAIAAAAHSYGNLSAQSLDTELVRDFMPENIRRIVPQLYVEPHWIGDSDQFWYRRETHEGWAYVLVDPDADTIRPLFDHAALAQALEAETGEARSPERLELDDLEIDPQQGELVFTAAGIDYVFQTGANELTAPPAASAEPVGLSPNGDRRVFVRGNNLWVESLESGEQAALTTDGAPDQPYATAVEFPAAILERLDDVERPAEGSWSEDGRYFATWRLDTRSSTRLQMDMPAGTGERRRVDYVYPRSMDPVVPAAELMVFDLEADEHLVLDTPPHDVRYYGGPYLLWVGRHELLVKRLDRNFRYFGLQRFDVRNGEGEWVLRQEHPDFVNEYDTGYWLIREWNSVLWRSDLDGFAHIYEVPLGGRREPRQLTDGMWRVNSFSRVDADRDLIWFVGAGREADRDPYYRHLYRLHRTSGEIRLLTPEPVDHGVYVSPSGAWFVDNMSMVDQPTLSVLRNGHTGEILRVLGEADVSVLASMGHVFPEPFSVRFPDGIEIYGTLYYPADFDPEARYPVIEHVYTGPHTFNAAKSFNQAHTGSALATAQIGAIAVQIDAEGTGGRSRAFLRPAWHTLGEVGIDRRIAVLRALASQRPYMDIERLGVYGFSAGGFDAARFILRRPGVYRAAVAQSGNHDGRWDKAIFNEQWLGASDAAVFERNSNIPLAGQLTGELMLMHGTNDQNVPVQATLQLADALTAAGKEFELRLVPDGRHYLEADPEMRLERLDFFYRTLIADSDEDAEASSPLAPVMPASPPSQSEFERQE